jgi:hypothetical protein
MYANLGFIDEYAKLRAAELRREADNERLAHQVSGSRRSLRVTVAGWLVAVAARLDTQAALAGAEGY